MKARASKAEERKLKLLVDRATALNVAVIRRRAQRLQEKYPKATRAELANRIFRGARWKATVAGVVTGLPGNLWLSVPAAAADVGAVAWVALAASATTALIYDPNFFDDELAGWELLAAALQIRLHKETVAAERVTAESPTASTAVETRVERGDAREFKVAILKHLAFQVGHNVLLTKAIPVVGVVIGGGWNNVEIRILRRRIIHYFESRAGDDWGRNAT